MKNDPEFIESLNHVVCGTSIGLAFCKLPSINDKEFLPIVTKLRDEELGHHTDQKEYIDISELGSQIGKNGNRLSNEIKQYIQTSKCSDLCDSRLTTDIPDSSMQISEQYSSIQKNVRTSEPNELISTHHFTAGVCTSSNKVDNEIVGTVDDELSNTIDGYQGLNSVKF